MKYKNGREAKLDDMVVARIGNRIVVGELARIEGDDCFISNVLSGFIAGTTAKLSECFHADDAFSRLDEYTAWQGMNFG